ncbi:hypothetical protein SBA5_750007 [Candidatus Sulfotelmatomonas gaucii]|uniref:Uncharacterized protein n=1 Tax=Candidatus Sulfuritelmatomonas gaucii TaxID=2043161 RepID=A0A2N9M3S4_9BACT|nr:hypothetical protein SBA5_750007 [Candidatus Sulfotelmatomonas gaucii]
MVWASPGRELNLYSYSGRPLRPRVSVAREGQERDTRFACPLDQPVREQTFSSVSQVSGIFAPPFPLLLEIHEVLGVRFQLPALLARYPSIDFPAPTAMPYSQRSASRRNRFHLEAGKVVKLKLQRVSG